LRKKKRKFSSYTYIGKFKWDWVQSHFMTFHPIRSEFLYTEAEENFISFMSVCTMYVFKHQVTLRKLQNIL
jgi:hypothetical protein